MSTGLFGLPWNPVCCLWMHHLVSLLSSEGEKVESNWFIRYRDAIAQKVEPPVCVCVCVCVWGGGGGTCVSV